MADRFRFGHLADTHVGAWGRAPALREALRRAVIEALEEVDRQELEFLVIAGDLFHTPAPDPEEVEPIAAALRRLVEHGRRIYAIYGSHDYLAHRTSWLDVLASAGVFVKVAPQAVRPAGERWTLPYLIDTPTGVRLAGIPGRPHGLDRASYEGMDASEFLASGERHVFLFHAAVEECLPPELRDHVRGIRRSDLPPGCTYYAGGHIHRPYQSVGPGGGLLVNPGAIFGTSRPDLANLGRGAASPGLVVVEVAGTSASARTIPPHLPPIYLPDIEVDGLSAREATIRFESALSVPQVAGALVVPRLKGRLAGGSLAELGVRATEAKARESGAQAVETELDVDPPSGTTVVSRPEAEIVTSRLTELLSASAPGCPLPATEEGLRRAAALLDVLAVPAEDGQTRSDYEAARLRAALAVIEGSAPPADRRKE